MNYNWFIDLTPVRRNDLAHNKLITIRTSKHCSASPEAAAPVYQLHSSCTCYSVPCVNYGHKLTWKTRDWYSCEMASSNNKRDTFHHIATCTPKYERSPQDYRLSPRVVSLALDQNGSSFVLNVGMLLGLLVSDFHAAVSICALVV